MAVVKGGGGKARLSSRVLQVAILQAFTEQKLFPKGVYAEIPAVQAWAMKHAKALKKLVSGTFMFTFTPMVLE